MVDAAAVSFVIVFLAEIGDKSQLISLAFATRYRASVVLLAITAASLLLSAGSVIVGAALALAVRTDVVQIAAGLVFLVLAPWILRNSGLGNGDKADDLRLSGAWAPLAIGAAIGTGLPERWLRRLSAAAFVVFGVVLIGQGLGLF